ncbi:MAG: DUF5676 family membrane protein [Nanoarchaeota archaeon]
MDKLDSNVVGLTLASLSAILYAICVVFYWIAPKTTLIYFNYLFHGVELSNIAKQIVFTDALIGLVLMSASAYLVGILFANLYNYFNKKY